MTPVQQELFLEYLLLMLRNFNANLIEASASKTLEDCRKIYGNYEFCYIAAEAFALCMKDEAKFVREHLNRKQDNSEPE